jgi:hypothetical protein
MLGQVAGWDIPLFVKEPQRCHLGAPKDPLGELGPEGHTFLAVNINNCSELFQMFAKVKRLIPSSSYRRAL